MHSGLAIFVGVAVLLAGLAVQRRWHGAGGVVLAATLLPIAWGLATLPASLDHSGVFRESRWSVLTAALAVAAVVVLWFGVRARPLAAPVCPRCGHDPRLACEPRCPECGVSLVGRRLRTCRRRCPALLLALGVLALAAASIRIPYTVAWGPIGLVPDWVMAVAWPWMPMSWITRPPEGPPGGANDLGPVVGLGTMVGRLEAGEWGAVGGWQTRVARQWLRVRVDPRRAMQLCSFHGGRSLILHIGHGPFPRWLVEGLAEALHDGVEDEHLLELASTVWSSDAIGSVDWGPGAAGAARQARVEALLRSAARHDTRIGRAALTQLINIEGALVGPSSIEMARWFVADGGPMRFGGPPMIEQAQFDLDGITELFRLARGDSSVDAEWRSPAETRSYAMYMLVLCADAGHLSEEARAELVEMASAALREAVGWIRLSAYCDLVMLGLQRDAYRLLVDALLREETTDDLDLIHAALIALYGERDSQPDVMLEIVGRREAELRVQLERVDAPMASLAAAVLLRALERQSGQESVVPIELVADHLDRARARERDRDGTLPRSPLLETVEELFGFPEDPTPRHPRGRMVRSGGSLWTAAGR